jgi:S-DNA-T family DNA segregation ATPase FtsK/SpoIIIE
MVGFVLIALTFFLFLSLASYHPQDPSLNVSSPETAYQNIIGKAGAWVSDILFQIFGLAALLLPIPLLFLGYKMIRDRRIDYPYVKSFGFLCTILSVSAGFSLSGLTIPISTNFAAGGLLGYILSELLRSHLNLTGSLLLVTTVFVVSLIITTRFSLDSALEWLSKRNWDLFGGWAAKYRTWQKHRDDRKELLRFRNSQSDLVNQPLPRRGRAAATEAIPEEPPVLPIPEEPYKPPSLEFLREPEAEGYIDEDELRERAEKLSTKCAEFDVHGQVLQIHPGPVVTTFEFKPDPGIKYSRITNLSDDLCLALKAESIRIDRVPGKNTVGIEVPNKERRTIFLRETLGSPEFKQSESKLTLWEGLCRRSDKNAPFTHRRFNGNGKECRSKLYGLLNPLQGQPQGRPLHHGGP